MMNFAWYGRVSTEDQQDPESSRAWQLRRSTDLIAPSGGVVVAEFFDIGLSRSLPWKRRPEASRLLTEMADPNRTFDAVVIGEPARAFYGQQFANTFPYFEHYGVALWVPEVGGAIDPASDAHEMIMSIFGGMSKAERRRIQVRVRTAMAAQAASGKRYLGGRPPYGYRLVDAGPHPNPAKANAGQRLHLLEPDPETAYVVARIFTEFLAGKGLGTIADGLVRDGIPSPSAHDRARNPHRSGVGWAKSAVRAILRNPRYTGHEVWNRQRRDEVLVDLDDVAMGHTSRMRWNDEEAWVWSDQPAHPALISPDDFTAADTVFKRRARTSASPRPNAQRRPYLFSGLIVCGACDRKLSASWNHGRAHYRCSLRSAYAVEAQQEGHPRSIYVPEKELQERLDAWLAGALVQERDHNIAALRHALDAELTDVEGDRVRAAIADCDRKLAHYRKALEGGQDLEVVIGWIAEVEAERRALGRAIQPAPQRSPGEPDLDAFFDHAGRLLGALRLVPDEDKHRLYADLGLRMTFDHTTRVMKVEIAPQEPWAISTCRRGDLNSRIVDFRPKLIYANYGPDLRKRLIDLGRQLGLFGGSTV